MAFVDGMETGRATLATAGAPAALRLTPDRATLDAMVGDLGYITLEVVDEHGAVVRHAAPEITVEVGGAGALIAIGSANPLSESLYTGNQCAAHEGRLMAVVRTAGQAGAIHVRASAAGLGAGEIELHARNGAT